MTKIDIVTEGEITETIHTDAYVVFYLDQDGQTWHTKGGGSVKAFMPMVMGAVAKSKFWPFQKSS